MTGGGGGGGGRGEEKKKRKKEDSLIPKQIAHSSYYIYFRINSVCVLNVTYKVSLSFVICSPKLLWRQRHRKPTTPSTSGTFMLVPFLGISMNKQFSSSQS